MPPFFDQSQLQNAITARALPTLEVLAEHPSHLERWRDRRFDRDDPPPYASSSESEEEEALRHPVMRSTQLSQEEFQNRMSEPLSEWELQHLRHRVADLYSPGARYLAEARYEEDRIGFFFTSEKANQRSYDLFKQLKGLQRGHIVARRNVRKRWERLGIWNPDWGIPGRLNKQPSDATTSWKWKWQSGDGPPLSDPLHPIRRAVNSRIGLALGEHVPPPPRSRLRDDASASEAESFIMSRPWFVLSLERADYGLRYWRFDPDHWPRGDEGDDEVTKSWKERGDWREDRKMRGYEKRQPVGWKWRHESPSPEPEDLTPLNTDDMDFTPSEVDALEAIPPDSPPRPKPPSTRDPSTLRFGTPGAPGYEYPFGHPMSTCFRVPAEEAPLDLDSESGHEVAPNSAPEAFKTPRRGPGRPQKRAPPGADVNTPAASPRPPSRRSVRIAAMDRSRPAPPNPVPQTRAPASRGLPAAPPARATRSAAADGGNRRSTPRVSPDSGVQKRTPAAKKGRKTANARTTGAVAEAAAAAVNGSGPAKRGGGRPRKAV